MRYHSRNVVGSAIVRVCGCTDIRREPWVRIYINCRRVSTAREKEGDSARILSGSCARHCSVVYRTAFSLTRNIMRNLIVLGLLCLVGVFAADEKAAFNQDSDWKNAKSIYDFHVKSITGEDVPLKKYEGKVLVIVNVASHCGLTDTNYKQLQQLYEELGDKGLRILAFPANDFANQEPGTSEEIRNFVKKYNVTFDMFEKIHVTGDEAHPLYKWLISQENGRGTITDGIKWNFTKFLVGKDGKVLDRFAPTTEPLSMKDAIVKAL